MIHRQHRRSIGGLTAPASSVHCAGKDGRMFVKRWVCRPSKLHHRHHVPAGPRQGQHADAGLLVNMFERARTLAEAGARNFLRIGTHAAQHARRPEYVLLNDAHVAAARHRLGQTRGRTARRLRSASPLKEGLPQIASYRATDGRDGGSRHAADRRVLSEHGYDVELDLIQATIRKRGYLPYNGGILLEDGRDASEHSALIRSLAQPNERCLIFVPEDVRDEMERSVREWIKPTQSSLAQFD